MWKPIDDAGGGAACGPYVHERKIRFGHSDAAGIAYTVRFFDFAMEAIEGWFEQVAGTPWYVINTELGYGTPFVHIEMDIKAPLRPGDHLACRVLVKETGRSSIRFGVDGFDGDDNLVFVSQWVCVLADNRAMKSIPIPDDLAARIAQYRRCCP